MFVEIVHSQIVEPVVLGESSTSAPLKSAGGESSEISYISSDPLDVASGPPYAPSMQT